MAKKVVINKCYGGFRLSEAAVDRYAKIKGITLYKENGEYNSLTGPTYWTVPEDQRPLQPEPWNTASMEDLMAYNEAYSNSCLSDRKLERDDPVLIQVIEELGEKAASQFSNPQIVEIPDNVDYQIEEYDGQEWVAEKHQTWS